MPDFERKKGMHLTLEDRQEIQRGLREHRSFKEIADIIGCSPDTVSKEIRNHRYHKVRENKKGVYLKPNRCKHRETCKRKDVCNKKKGHKCRIPCRECLKCNELCPDFIDVIIVRSRRDACLTSIFTMQTMHTGNTEKNCVNPEKELI